jgi:hypothetical protein
MCGNPRFTCDLTYFTLRNRLAGKQQVFDFSWDRIGVVELLFLKK